MKKTGKPELVSNNAGFTLLNIKTGTLLVADIGLQQKARFAVVGVSHNDYALVRIYEQGELPEVMNIFPELFVTLSTGINGYADCSRIVVRRYGDISKWIKRYPETPAGRLSGDDVHLLIKTIRDAKTITAYQKIEFNII